MRILTGLKKLIVMLVVLAMLVSMLPTAFADSNLNFVDFPTGWSKVAVTAAVNNGLLRGFDGNEIRPQANLTRAELATIVTRAFGATAKADISAYTDVANGAWYYESIAKAVQMGILKGVSTTSMAPDNPITREEVFTAVSRALVLSSDDFSSLGRFNDAARISEYAKSHIAELASKNYVNGDTEGNLNPKANITREEFAQFMHNLIKTYITKSGTYTGDFAGIVVVRTKGVTFKDATINGDLVIGDGVGTGEIRITNTDIKGRLVVRAGVITVKGSTNEDGVVVNNPNGTTYFKNTGREKFFDGLKGYTKHKFTGTVGGGSTTTNMVTVKFKVGNEIVKTIQVERGTEIGDNFPADPTLTGYSFGGWYLNGTRVTPTTVISSTVEIEAVFNIKTYTVTYKDVEFKAGHEPVTSYTIEDEVPNLPEEEDLTEASIPAGYYLAYWMDSEDNEVKSLQITENTPINIELQPHFEEKTNLYMVNFYIDYGNNKHWMETQNVGTISTPGYAVPPAITYTRNGFVKPFIEGMYGLNEKHVIKPSFWYVNDKNEFVPFDKTVAITKDTDVYMLYRKMNVSLTLGAADEPIVNVSARYEDDTRIMDSVKDFLYDGKGQLEPALQLPEIKEKEQLLINKLVEKDIIDADKNIKVLNVQIPISTIIKEDAADDMIQQYIKDTFNNPDQLDAVLSMMDISSLASQIDIGSMLEKMEEEELADLISGGGYEEKIAEIIVNDLKSQNPTMMDMALDYITTDSTFRAKMVNDLINELKVVTPTGEQPSALKTAAISHLRTILSAETDTTGMQALFVDMMFDSLEKEDTDPLKQLVLGEIKSLLTGAEGASYRKKILTSDKLPDLMATEPMKTKVLNLLVDEDFLDKVLANAGFKSQLISYVKSDKEFVKAMVLSQIHTGFIADSIKTSITDENFKSSLVDKVLVNESFKEAIKKGEDTAPDGVLRAELLNALTFDNFIKGNFTTAQAAEEDLLKFVFNQAGYTGTYSFINAENDIEPIFKDKFDELYRDNPSTMEDMYGSMTYSGLSDENKQKFKDDLFGDDDVKDTVLNKIKEVFEEYKESIVDKIANGEQITDDLILKEIGNALAEFIVDYIDKKLSGDTETTIETFLVDYVMSVCDEEIPSTDPRYQLKQDFDAMLTNDDVIKSVVSSNAALVKSIVGKNGNYSTLTATLATMIRAEGSTIYADVEAQLMTILSGTSADSMISGFVKTNVAELGIEEDINDALANTISTMSDADIEKYVAEFLGMSNDNVTLVKTQVESFLESDDQKAEVEKLATKYIKEEDISADILGFVESIDKDFVEEYRETMLSVLDGVDLSSMVDKDFIITYVGTLKTQAEKDSFATKVYDAFSKTDDYKNFMQSLFHEKTFKITASNKGLIQAISGALREIDYDTIMGKFSNEAIDKLINILGEDVIKGYFDTTKTTYCDGLDVEIAKVSDTVESSYTTSLTLTANPIAEILKPLYDKAKVEVEEKLQNANVYYNENIYLKYLVEDDIIAELLSGDESATDELTGYSIKGIMDYYNYMYKLIVVADDALCWYGGNSTLSEAEIDAIHEAIVGKIARVNEKLNEILEAFATDGTLPGPAQQIVDKVSQLKSLLDKFESQLNSGILKYLNSDVSELLGDTEKTGRLLDFLFGNEEDVINIDRIYSIFYNYEDNLQAKLKELIDSGKLQEAVDKFETTSAGDKLFANPTVEGAYSSVYDLLVDLAEEGVDKFKVSNDNETTIDEYQVSIGAVTLNIERLLSFYDN